MSKEKIFNFLKNSDLLVAKAEASLFICDLYFSEYAKMTAVGRAISPVVAMVKDRTGFQVTKRDDPMKLVEALYQQYKKDNQAVLKLQNQHIEVAQKMRNIWPGRENLKKLSNQELLALSEEFLPFAKESVTMDAIGEDKGAFLEKLLIPRLKEVCQVAEQEARGLLGILSHPEELAVFSEEEKIFLKLCLELKINDNQTTDNFRNNVKKYLKKLFWFNSSFYESVEITEGEIIAKVRDYSKKKTKDEIENKIENLLKGSREVQKQRTEIIKKFNFSEEDSKKIDFAVQTSYWFDLRKALMMEKIDFSICFAYEIGRRFGLDKNQSVGLKITELMALLKGEKLDLESKIEQNKKVVMFFDGTEDRVYLYGDDYDEALKIINSKNNKETKLKGQVASKGGQEFVEGFVKVMISAKAGNFNQGDILVTSMTRVEFVPLMRLAKAIITDEGGIVSHAAIVSREMGVPCVIGTGKATQTLKTGDKVRMDLKNGVIKILK